MKKQPNKKLIGFFALSGAALFIAVMFIFVGDKIFVKDKDLAVLYFSESLKGLRVGSPVVFRGVEIGKIAKIDIVADLDDMSFRLPVYININQSILKKYGHSEIGNKKRFVTQMVDRGLKGRLTSQNILTGQLMIELEIMPDHPIVYRGGVGKVVEIPTVLSPMGELSKGFQDLPIKSVLENFNNLITNTNNKLPVVLDELGEAVKSINRLADNSDADRVSAIDNLNKTIKDVGEAAQALRSFADYIERHPEALLRGKGGY
ncbi:MAG: MlaD family protein [Lactobacillaceae bacterium]|jgi:paraquat-inducible protein B|nr:MlaD family protein [Lactobacillaceae bacterium]